MPADFRGHVQECQQRPAAVSGRSDVKLSMGPADGVGPAKSIGVQASPAADFATCELTFCNSLKTRVLLTYFRTAFLPFRAFVAVLKHQ